MSAIRTSSTRKTGYDHFEPQDFDDPQLQKRIRGYLEQIDYTAFAANREILGQTVGAIDTARLQHLAVAAAHARAAWVKQALVVSEGGASADMQQIDKLAHLRFAFDELSEAYEGMRRMIERGYLAFTPQTPPQAG